MARSIRIAIALASAVVVLAPFLPASAHGDGRLEEIEAEIAQKRRRIEHVEHEAQAVRAEIDAAERDRAGLAAEVRDLGSRLEEARVRLAEVRERLAVARLQLRRWGEKLADARAELRRRRQTLQARAAEAYKLGPGGYLEILLGADDFASLVDRVAFVENVLTIDSDLVTGMELTRSLVVERRDTVDRIEGRVARRYHKVRERAERIAELRAEQAALLAEIDLEIRVRGDLLADLEENRERYEQAVAELEAESDRIRGLIQGSGSTGSGGGHGQLFWPTAGSIVSGFGWRTHPIFGTKRFHAGVDIDGACGQPIWAADAGQVISAGYGGGYGNVTIVDHGGGLSTLYAHQSSFAVSSGQRVSRGQTIGYVGTTGWSTGCHLHFEVRVNGEPVDPVPYLT